MHSFTSSKLPSFNGLVAIITLFFFFFLSSSSAARLQLHLKTDNNEFIKTSCGETLYPKLCYKTLSAYATTIQTSPMELANVSLSLSLKSAQSTSKKVLNLSKDHSLSPREAGAIMDCVENMGESVDELQQSLVAMKNLEGPEFNVEMSNIQTWVSAALTNEDTCMDGWEGKGINEKIKGSIRVWIESVAQLTSISLALIDRLSST